MVAMSYPYNDGVGNSNSSGYPQPNVDASDSNSEDQPYLIDGHFIPEALRQSNRTGHGLRYDHDPPQGGWDQVDPQFYNVPPQSQFDAGPKKAPPGFEYSRESIDSSSAAQHYGRQQAANMYHQRMQGDGRKEPQSMSSDYQGFLDTPLQFHDVVERMNKEPLTNARRMQGGKGDHKFPREMLRREQEERERHQQHPQQGSSSSAQSSAIVPATSKRVSSREQQQQQQQQQYERMPDDRHIDAITNDLQARALLGPVPTAPVLSDFDRKTQSYDPKRKEYLQNQYPKGGVGPKALPAIDRNESREMEKWNNFSNQQQQGRGSGGSNHMTGQQRMQAIGDQPPNGGGTSARQQQQQQVAQDPSRPMSADSVREAAALFRARMIAQHRSPLFGADGTSQDNVMPFSGVTPADDTMQFLKRRQQQAMVIPRQQALATNKRGGPRRITCPETANAGNKKNETNDDIQDSIELAIELAKHNSNNHSPDNPACLAHMSASNFVKNKGLFEIFCMRAILNVSGDNHFCLRLHNCNVTKVFGPHFPRVALAYGVIMYRGIYCVSSIRNISNLAKWVEVVYTMSQAHGSRQGVVVVFLSELLLRIRLGNVVDDLFKACHTVSPEVFLPRDVFNFDRKEHVQVKPMNVDPAVEAQQTCGTPEAKVLTRGKGAGKGGDQYYSFTRRPSKKKMKDVVEQDSGDDLSANEAAMRNLANSYDKL